MRNSLWFLLLLSLFTACHTTEKKETPDFLAENIDTTVNPANDFFLYANGGWIKKNPIPADQSAWGVGFLVQEDIYSRLRTINEKALDEKSEPGSVSQKIGDFWFSGMDSAGIEKQGIQPLQPQLQEIEKIGTIEDLLHESAILQNKGVGVLLGEDISQDEKNSDKIAFHIYQGGLGMSNRDYYFNTDAKTLKVRKAYQLYLYNAFRSMGKDSAAATSAANGVYELETRLAKASRKLEKLRDPDSNYHKMGLGSMQKLYFRIGWNDFFKNTGVKSLDSVIVGQPEFLVALNQELTKTPLNVWKNYLAFHLLKNSARYMDQALYKDLFAYSQSISGVETPKARWKRVLDAEETAMGEALGQLFVKEYFPEKTKQRYNDLVEAIR